ncbi:MAG TPA: redoxin domain-containing protein [Candidatus Deferrimicrobiaceae bacterium]|nr:redoxin domain-containing protein [Candidatus Deferrimicrobiaceae bacterium]
MGRGRFILRGSTFLAGIVFVCLGYGALTLTQAQQTAFGLDGKPSNPLAQASGKVVVLVFLRQDCPVSSRYAPVIQQISGHYQHDASFFLIYPDRAESAQTIRKYLADYGYHLPALRDPEHALVKRALAEITPEAAVFNREGKLIYHGRIDNWYVEFGRSRPAPTTHELSDAIDAAIAGKPVAESAIKGVGCYISDLE